MPTTVAARAANATSHAVLNLGLIGAGRIGRVHAANLAYRIPTARLAAVADVSEAAAQQVAQQFHVPVAATDYRAILADPAIDAVLICSATDTHARIIVEAAQAGKHIFCEKPIDHTLAKIDWALAAVEQAGVKLQIGFNRRFDANYARVRQAIVQGEIGQPHLLHIISRDPAPPPIEYIKVSGGIFLDMTIHDFDMARFLMGCEAVEVYAVGGVLVDPQIGEAGDLDTALITLKFENGAFGTIDNSRRAVYGYDQRVEVLGSRGSIATGNNYPNTAIISSATEVRRDLPLNFFMERYTEAYVAEMVAFVEAVRLDKPVPVGGKDGRVPVVMGLAARKSVAENRPVRLDEIGDNIVT
ncbi:MAG TPA: inositol 2-dehydrogenase [Caldilineaceae bacterium]|nr:inositol 2-dehydrogenase [Caldilineaceae bacterium]